jgi:uncharacterized protein YceK
MRGLLLAIGTISLCACSTVVSKSDGGFGEAYSGTQLAYRNFSQGGPRHPLVLIVVAADMPLSAIADTLVLPVDLLCRDSGPTYSAEPSGDPVLPP